MTSINRILRTADWSKLQNLRTLCVTLVLLILTEKDTKFNGKVYRGVNLPKNLLQYYDP